MKMKKTAMLLTALALGVFAAHAGAETINSDKYATVNEAVAALQDGDTLVITKDSAFNNEDFIDSLEFNSESILDLNGHTLTWKGEYTSFNVNKKLTIIDSKQSGGKIDLKDNCISATGATLILESGTLVSDGTYVVTAGVQDRESNIIIKGGEIKSLSNKYAIGSSCKTNIDISGGTIIGDISVSGHEETGFGKVVISGGVITGEFIDLNEYGENDKNKDLYVMEVTGGTFTDNSYAAYMKEGYTKIPTENGYVIGKQAAAKVVTENVVQETVADTNATGFVTTISSQDTFDLKTIKWDVTYNNETKSTKEYKLDGVTLSGDVKIGLAVDGFADANATAAATINGYIK